MKALDVSGYSDARTVMNGNARGGRARCSSSILLNYAMLKRLLAIVETVRRRRSVRR